MWKLANPAAGVPASTAHRHCWESWSTYQVLRVQHTGGRKLTGAIMKGTKVGKAATAEQRRALVSEIQNFGRVYAPHSAWAVTEGRHG
jgi:hypothetical protein